MGFVLMVVNMFLNVSLALAYRAPYSPSVISIGSFLIAVAICSTYTGLWNWFAVFITAGSAFMLGMEIFFIDFFLRRMIHVNSVP